MSFNIDIPNSVGNTGGYTFDLVFTPTLVPEPGSAVIFTGLAGALACRRTRRGAARG